MIAEYLYAFFIFPIEYFIETVYSISINMIPNYGLAILSVSIAVQLLTLPIYKFADALQDKEREKQKKMSKWISHIRKSFKGDERVMMLQEYYRVEQYHPLYSLRSSLSILLQIPFFIAAYHYLSNLSELNGNSFSILRDLGKPDALLTIGGLSINLLPIVMTAINILSGVIYTRGFAFKEKIQLYLTALVFLVLLYNSPAGLVFYWTLNNVFSLVKNIFMKVVKEPRKFIDIACLAFGILFVFYCIYKGKLPSASKRLIMYLVFICCCIPGIVSFVSSKGRQKASVVGNGLLNRYYFAEAVSMTLILGLMIPSAIVAESPQEFVVQGHYVDPNHFVLHAVLVASGIFLLWMYIIFRFMNEGIKKTFLYTLWIGICITMVDYFFFSQGLGNMNAMLRYDRIPRYSVSQKMINLAVVVIIGIIALVFVMLKQQFVYNICMILNIVLLLLGGINVVKTEKILSDMSFIKNDNYYNENKPELTFSKNGKNVIVIMLDRAVSGYLPYILEEKPELKDKLSGFVYYPNTLSTGGGTAAGAPALYGGFEYTTYDMYRPGREMVDKHDESLRVLPKIFSDNGFACKVIDVPYPGYGTKSVKDLYDDLDNVSGYNMSGYAKTPEQAEFENNYFNSVCTHNMIRHGIFIAAPIVLRHGIYHNGSYLSREEERDYNVHYWALQQYKSISDTTEDQPDTFFMLCNDTTHFNIELQLPDYTEDFNRNNEEYWDDWLKRFSDNGVVKVHMEENGEQVSHYMVEVATLLELGRWFDKLREMGVYDNTRIVITSDHGYPLHQFDDMILEDGVDIELLNPIFLYKDFNSKGFSVCSDFTANADAPLKALSNIVDDPINPFSGNSMIDVKKKAEEDGLIVTDLGYIHDMKDSSWYRVADDIFDHKNWKKIAIPW